MNKMHLEWRFETEHRDNEPDYAYSTNSAYSIDCWCGRPGWFEVRYKGESVGQYEALWAAIQGAENDYIEQMRDTDET